jgi:hypothetical protein
LAHRGFSIFAINPYIFEAEFLIILFYLVIQALLQISFAYEFNISLLFVLNVQFIMQLDLVDDSSVIVGIGIIKPIIYFII